MKRLFALVLTFLPLVSCVSVHVENILNDVETYISERPDSALAVLDSIDRDMLTTRKVTSHHALLYAMALDKNFIDVSDDSLAMTALEYYEHHGDRKYKARALYYLGLSHYYSQEYDKAIIEFTKAEEVAQKHDSLYWGMTKVAQADTYGRTFNSTEETECLLLASDILEEVSSYHYYVSQLRLAQVYIDEKQYLLSEGILKALLSQGVNTPIYANALRSYAYLNVVSPFGDCKNAAELYQNHLSEFSGEYMTLRDYWAWSYSLYCQKSYEDSNNLVSQLIQIDTTIVSDYWQYLLAKEDSNYKIALSRLENVLEKNEREVETALKQELSLKQRDYYAMQSKWTLYKMYNRTIMLFSAIIVALMIIGYLIIFYRGYIKKQNEEKERYMEYVAEIIRQLEEVKCENSDSLKRKYIELYKSKFEVLRSLSDQYLMTENRVDAEEKMYQKVISLVNDIRNDEEHRAKFEAMLDNDLDGIMTNFRNELPKLKEIDYAIFSYWIIGFDVTTISRLLDTSLNIIYIRRSRIKQQIRDKAPEHMYQFLEMIS